MARSEIQLKNPENQGKGFEQLSAKHPEVGKAILKGSWNYIGHSNVDTVKTLNPLWMKNIDTNVKNKLWKKCGSVRKTLVNFGKNKAIIAVGAGQSFNKNKDVLKRVSNKDGVRDWEYRDFIIIASNHQFKPLLDMGIIPDFVVLVDGSDVVYDQLTKDIPKEGQHSTLLAGLHCSPKVMSEWVRQKRELRFFLTTTKEVKEQFHKATGKMPYDHVIMQGGNVLNTALTMGLQVFDSRVFMAVGNDLSFPLEKDLDERRSSYYADGDYSSNARGTGTGRDEASSKFMWLGFNLKKKPGVEYVNYNSYDIELDPVGVSRTLWVYKTWIESNMVLNSYKPEAQKVHYYNCSEGGILGVMARKDDDESLNDINNWFMLDETCSYWHTAKLEDAVEQFYKAKDLLTWETKATV